MILNIIASLIALFSAYQFDCTLGHQAWRKQPRLYLNEREILAPTAHSFPLIVDSQDQVVSKSILDTGSWQPQNLAFIASIVKKGNSILNLGSQTGLEAILMGKLVGGSGKLIILEPYSISYKIVVKNIQINSLSEISQVYKLGAGKQRQILKLWIDKINTGHSTFVKDKQVSSTFQEIEVDSVDNILGKLQINFALIDVQMFQVQALLGMREILLKSPSIIALVQWSYLNNQNRNSSQTGILLDWLTKEGFKWYRLNKPSDICKMGTIELLKPGQLLEIKDDDLVLAGKTANLPQFFKKK